MRRLALFLLAAVAVVPTAAFAARAAPGDGVFELQAVNGLVVLTGKGVVWGQMDHGILRVTDLDPTVGLVPYVSGAEHVRATDDPNTTIYSGTNIHFRLTGGKYRLRFHGTSIDLTAVGVGVARSPGSRPSGARPARTPWTAATGRPCRSTSATCRSGRSRAPTPDRAVRSFVSSAAPSILVVE